MNELREVVGGGGGGAIFIQVCLLMPYANDVNQYFMVLVRQFTKIMTWIIYL